MTARYIALVLREDTATALAARTARAEALCREAGLTRCHCDGRLFVAADTRLPVYRSDNLVVLGDVHARDAGNRLSREEVAARLEMSPPGATALLERFWGDFVALLRLDEGREIQVTRSAFGRLACLWTHDAGGVAIASDMALLETFAGGRRSVNVPALARRLARPGLPLSETCLENVDSVAGGNTLVIDANGHMAQGCAWSPWSATGPEHWYDTHAQALEAVRAAIFTSTAANRRDVDRVLLMLSGGVDSSVLAATLAALGGAYDCVNLVQRDSSGDERRFARAVTRHLGAEMVEIDWALDDIDVTRSQSAALPNPANRVFMQGTNAALERALAHTGADLLMDGGGGDNVFLGLNSVAPVTDALFHDGLAAAVATGRCVAALSQSGLATVLRLAVGRRFRRSPAFRWHADLAFLNPEIGAAVGSLPRHPWLTPPRGAATGTAAHVALMAAAQGWAEECDIVSSARRASPLATQPVVEACLKVPSWWWYSGGRNRAVARQAYAGRLPVEVVMRQTKGSPDSYVAQIYATHRKTVRAMLLDGHLRRLGLLDAKAIEQATAASGPALGTHYDRLLQLSQVEAWLHARA